MSKLTIQEIKDLLLTIKDLEDSRLLELRKDPRKGVQRLLVSHKKRVEKQTLLIQAHREKLLHENRLKKQGYRFIAGIDEVGRGPLAGPIVTAAVVLPEDTSAFLGIDDSKRLSESKRLAFAEIIKKEALAYSIAIGSVDLIDRVNIYQATRKTMTHSVEGLSIIPEYLLIDAMTIDSPLPQESIIKGDQNSLSIAAASVLAKVHRDQIMKEYDHTYPGYDFGHNMGYGTANHLKALRELGYTPIHRKSFEPIKSMV